MLTSSIISS